MSNKLSAQDQKLLKTDLGYYEKVAEQQLEAAKEAYSFGADYAIEVAQNIEKRASQENQSLEMIKQASDDQIEMADGISSFMLEGFNDGLAKIASEIYGNEDVFFVCTSVPMLKTAGYDTSDVEAELAQLGLDKVAHVNPMSLLTKVAAESEEDEDEDEEVEKNASSHEEALAMKSYLHGEKLASAFVDGLFKVAEEDEDEDEDEQEKEASAGVDAATYQLADELSMFVEKGFFDKLASLGGEVYGDEAVYISELVKEASAAGMARRVKRKALVMAEKGKRKAKDIKGKARTSAMNFAEGVKADAKTLTGKPVSARAASGSTRDFAPGGMKEQAMAAGRLGLKVGLPAGAVVGTGEMARRKMMNKEAGVKDLASRAGALASKGAKKVKSGYSAAKDSVKKNYDIASGKRQFDSLGISSKPAPMKDRAIASAKLVGSGAAVAGTGEAARRKMMSKEASKMQKIRGMLNTAKDKVTGHARDYKQSVKKDFGIATGKPYAQPIKGSDKLFTERPGDLKQKAKAGTRLALKTVVPAGATGGGLYAATKKKKED
jgi:hypothetical protein